jgi:hypothetical protein
MEDGLLEIPLANGFFPLAVFFVGVEGNFS